MVNVEAQPIHLKKNYDNTTECGIKLFVIGVRITATDNLSHVTCAKCLESSRMKEYMKIHPLVIA